VNPDSSDKRADVGCWHIGSFRCAAVTATTDFLAPDTLDKCGRAIPAHPFALHSTLATDCGGPPSWDGHRQRHAPRSPGHPGSHSQSPLANGDDSATASPSPAVAHHDDRKGLSIIDKLWHQHHGADRRGIASSPRRARQRHTKKPPEGGFLSRSLMGSIRPQREQDLDPCATDDTP
jgi:hypothetical protein